MNLLSRLLIAPAVALAYFALPATASADRVYYLVGVRHVYRIGTDKYAHSTERQQIEQDYADEVSADNAHYQYQITHGGDTRTESDLLQSALQDLAAERETRLGGIYEQSDSVRLDHSSLNIRVDGPYQVIGIDYHNRDNVQVWDTYTAYAPWPGYISEGPNPYGWNYGYGYSPSLFVGTYNGWYGGWSGYGRPAYVGLYGTGGPMVVAGLSINLGFGIGVGGLYGGYFSNPGLRGFYRSGPGYFRNDPFRGGYIGNRNDPRAAMAGRAGSAAGRGAIRSAQSAGYGGDIRAGSGSSFAPSGVRSGATRTNSGYAHSYTGGTTRTGSGGVRRTTTSGGNSGYSNRNRGGVGRPSGGTVRTSSTVRSSGGSMQRSQTSVRSSSSGVRRSSGTMRTSGGGRPSGGSMRTSGGGRPSGGGRSGGGQRGGGGGGKRGKG